MIVTRTVKNKSLKMSPGGLITLPVAARKALAMRIGKGSVVSFHVESQSIVVSAAPTKGAIETRISRHGNMELSGDAKKLLEGSIKRHYWFEASDPEQRVVLHPFRP
jgi:hypothetical protein